MSTNSPTLEQLRRATALAEQIEQLQSELTSLLRGGEQQGQGSSSSSLGSGSASSPARASQGAQGGGQGAGKRVISTEARAKMAAAQKARWAKVNGGKASSTSSRSAQSRTQSKTVGNQQKSSGKRTMSPEAREKIAAAQRARWARQKKS